MHDLGAPVDGPGANPALGGLVAPERRRSRFARWFDSWMRSLGMALVLFLIIKTFFFEAFQIASGSMTHTLLTGDFLFVNKALYGAQIPGTRAWLPGFRTPRLGDVIVFAFPRDPRQDYVKRVIARPATRSRCARA
jgi:signal peptidase I